MSHVTRRQFLGTAGIAAAAPALGATVAESQTDQRPIAVEKNVGFGLRMRGVPAAEIATRVAKAMRILLRQSGLSPSLSRGNAATSRQSTAIGHRDSRPGRRSVWLNSRASPSSRILPSCPDQR